MNLNDRVRIMDFDVPTDHPPEGTITKLYFKFHGTPFEREMAEVKMALRRVDCRMWRGFARTSISNILA